MPAKDWKLVSTGPATDYFIFRLAMHRYRLEPAGDERDFVVLDADNWVNVMAITPDQQIVLIRQFRHGIREVAWEVPGGIMDPGEKPEEAALRELREETGYVGDSVRLLGDSWPNPAMQNNRLYTCLVENARLAGEQETDQFERIEVETRPLAEVPHLIRTGIIRHSLVMASFSLLGIAAGPGKQ